MGLGGQRHAPAALPPGKTRYLLYKRLVGAQDQSGRLRKLSTPPGFDPRTGHPVASRYTDWAIPALYCVYTNVINIRCVVTAVLGWCHEDILCYWQDYMFAYSREQRSRCFNTESCKICFFLLQIVHTCSKYHLASCVMDDWASTPWVKRSDREADHSHQSNASLTLLDLCFHFLTCVNDLSRDSFRLVYCSHPHYSILWLQTHLTRRAKISN